MKRRNPTNTIIRIEEEVAKLLDEHGEPNFTVTNLNLAYFLNDAVSKSITNLIKVKSKIKEIIRD